MAAASALTELSELLLSEPKALGLLALFASAIYFLLRAPHHHSPKNSKPLGVTDAVREAKPLDAQRVKAIYNILCSRDQEGRKTKGKCEYTIGIITALKEEFRATIAMLDEEHNAPSDFQKPSEDSNDYVWGRIARHNVVIVSFPSGIYGTSIAARVATLLVSAFPSIRLGFMVGIGGGVPSPSHDIRLGDIVVSQPGQGTAGGVVQYDLGKEEERNFRCTGSLNKPPSALLSALTSFRARPRIFELCETIHHASMAIYQAFEFDEATPTYAYQGSDNDRLFQAASGLTFLPWKSSRPIERRKRPRPEAPTIHYGLIASGNRVMKNGSERDKIFATLKRETNGGECLCFEMEAAGLMDNFPCLVIRGISDYADSHKGHSWHGYAAMTAAAFARELLHILKPPEVELSAKARDVMFEVRQDVQEIKADVSTLSNVATVQKIQRWLAPSDHSKNFEDAQESCYSKTNAWFFEHNTYQYWVSGEIDCIWLHGPSGCGKTVLSSTMIDALMRNGPCLYFFFDFRDEKKQTLRELLLSLICQLYSTSNGPREVLHRLYSSRDWNQTKPSTTNLIEVFDNMLEHSGEVKLVLDALDESKKGRDREELLQWLHRQIQRTFSKNSKLRIIITSRSEQHDIIGTLGPLVLEKAQLSIEENSFKVRDDIRKYIEQRIAKDRMFARWRNEADGYPVGARSRLDEEFVSKEESCFEKEVERQFPECDDSDFDALANESKWDPILRKARDVLVEKAGTMFRWASLQLDSLGSLGTSAMMEEALADLPEGLNDIYARSLREIPKRHRYDAIRILQMTLASKRGLAVEDMLVFTSVDLEATPGHSINHAKMMKDLAPFSSILSVLIKIRTRRVTVHERRCLEIAHSSVMDYLYSQTPEPCLDVTFSEISSRISVLRVCLACLMTFKDLPGQYYPPLSYAWEEWITHAEIQEVEKEAYEDILRYLLYSGTVKCQKKIGFWTFTGPPLYLASRLGLSNTVKRLLERGISPKEPGGNASTMAAIRTDSYYKKKLIEFQVDPEEPVGQVNVNPKGARLEYALHAACLAGNSEIVELLLKNGADVNAQNEDHETPLYVACGVPGKPDTVRALLDYGADSNAKGGEYGTPLFRACLLGKADFPDFPPYWRVEMFNAIVKMLLDHGADPNDCSMELHFGSPLLCAASQFNPCIVQTLLKKGADVDYRHNGKYTALERAIKRENFGVVQVLIENGATFDLLSLEHQMYLLEAKDLGFRATGDEPKAESQCCTPIVAKRLEDLERQRVEGELCSRRPKDRFTFRRRRDK